MVALQSESEHRGQFLRGLPALLGFCLLLFGVIYTLATRESVTTRYVSLMQTALKEGDYKLASTLGGRLMSDSSERKPEVAFRYALALSRSGEPAKATSIINSLAPDDQVGYAPAHQIRAMQYAQTQNPSSSADSLAAFRWHLSNCGNADSEQTLMLWASYHQRVGQMAEAIRKIEQAAKLNSTHLVTLAELYRQSGDEAASNRALKSARDSFQKQVDENPLEKGPRLQLALSLAKLSQMDEAEGILLAGLKISKAPEILRATADFYLLKYDLEIKKLEEPQSLAKSFEFLETAIRLDPSYVPIYDRLIQLHSLKSKEQGEHDVVKLLEEMIVDGKHAATAHFALSSVLTIDGKSAESMQHLEQAFRLSPNMPAVCNNLAWMLASGNPPKLDEALELSQKAVQAVPEAASFRDTLGTILLAQGKYKEAITQLEIVLSQNSSETKLHSKLAKAYEGMGNLEIAKMHREKAK
jgi:tetratricopeptide (TPR) repeat protein